MEGIELILMLPSLESPPRISLFWDSSIRPEIATRNTLLYALLMVVVVGTWTRDQLGLLPSESIGAAEGTGLLSGGLDFWLIVSRRWVED